MMDYECLMPAIQTCMNMHDPYNPAYMVINVDMPLQKDLRSTTCAF